MKFSCQLESLEELKTCVESKRHSVLLEGPAGCGKTYLAKTYASMLNIVDYQMIQPTVGDIRSTIESCSKLDSNIVVNIENLDLGVSAASYALLKFLEEPSENVYIVVTVRNINNIPDTIISRSVCITTSPPTDNDVSQYAISVDNARWNQLSNLPIQKCVHTFSDVDIVLKLDNDKLSYFNNLSNLVQFNKPISEMMWTLGHYSDKSETPIELVIQYIISICNNKHIERSGIECIRNLQSTRIAKHAVLAKFLFECKYCE